MATGLLHVSRRVLAAWLRTSVQHLLAPDRRRTVSSEGRHAMRLDFKNFSVEIDAEATRRAYEGLPRTDERCSCAGCQNFPLAIGKALSEEGRHLFESMGVDPAKATEAYVNCARDEGTIFYGAWYHLFGRIERRVETVPDVRVGEGQGALDRR